MELKNWAEIATIIGALAIPFSGLFIWLQLRHQTSLTRAANAQALVELSSPFNLQLIQDSKLAEFWIQGAAQFNNYDPIMQYRYKSMLIWWLILHENIYVQWRGDLLDDATYKSWDNDLRSFARLHQLQLRWPELRDTFQPEFRNYVSSILPSGSNTCLT